MIKEIGSNLSYDFKIIIQEKSEKKINFEFHNVKIEKHILEYYRDYFFEFEAQVHESSYSYRLVFFERIPSEFVIQARLESAANFTP